MEGPSTKVAFSFRRLATGLLLYNASGGVLYAILPLFEFQEGGGALLATLVVGAPLLATTLGAIAWGTLSDRWGRRREILALGVLVQSALFLAYPWLSPLALVLVRIVQAFLGAASALATAQATEDPSRTAGAGLGGLSFWGSVGSVLGIVAALPFLRGSQFSIHSESALVLFVLLGSFSAASVAFLLGTGDIQRGRTVVRLGDVFRFRDGRAVLLFCGVTAVVACGNYVVYTLFPLWVNWAITPQGVLGAGVNSTVQLAVLSIGASMGGVIVSPWAGRVAEGGPGRRRLYVLAPVIYAVLWLSFVFTHNYPIVFFIWALPIYVLLSIPLLREIAGRTSPQERGRAVGLWNAAYGLGGLAGTLLAGAEFSGSGSFGWLFTLAAFIDLLAFAGFAALAWMGRAMPPGGDPAGASPEMG